MKRSEFLFNTQFEFIYLYSKFSFKGTYQDRAVGQRLLQPEARRLPAQGPHRASSGSSSGACLSCGGFGTRPGVDLIILFLP
jgi:hypothetical protein